LFETDPQTTERVSGLMLELERHGMDAVWHLSRQFDEWEPESLEF
jgi:hypothetical protein